MFGPYLHHIDPVVADIAGAHLRWYGLGFALGLLHFHFFVMQGRERLGLTPREVWSLSLFIAIGVLIGGRLIEVAFDEWPFYRHHPRLIPALWLGVSPYHCAAPDGAE